MAGESARDKARRAREKSERLARYAESWEKGADGESQTAAALGQLGPEWTHWHDLRWPGRRFANIDHLAIGPGGIFVIDSKNWSGTLTVKGDVLRQNGYRRETAVAGCADSALAVGELVPRYMDRVMPVICFARDDDVEGWARDVMLCSTTTLVTMLTSRQPVLGTDEIADATVTLQARMNSMSTPTRTTAPTASRSPRTARTKPVPASESPRATTKPATRFFRRAAAALGIWFLSCNAAFLLLRPHAGGSGAIFGPVYLALAVVAWIFARRIVK